MLGLNVCWCIEAMQSTGPPACCGAATSPRAVCSSKFQREWPAAAMQTSAAAVSSANGLRLAAHARHLPAARNQGLPKLTLTSTKGRDASCSLLGEAKEKKGRSIRPVAKKQTHAPTARDFSAGKTGQFQCNKMGRHSLSILAALRRHFRRERATAAPYRAILALARARATRLPAYLRAGSL